MRKQKSLTDEQIQELLKSEFVEKVFKNRIIYTKDEVEYRECKTLEEIRDKIEQYIYYYNTGRYQWGLNKMTPYKFRQYLQTSY